ncbi:MAG: hypothetical protein OEV44_02175, partial [Spirochaetota bacterium]|nr:hypothetical protein [Spirochaetota bacterium]
MRLKNRGIVFLFLILLALSSCESNSNSSNSVSLNNLSVKENVIVNKDPKALATANKFQNAVR